MVHLLLAVIYLSFISLGLPDALLGAAWPSMYGEFSVPVSYAGAVSMIISAGTILSSLLSDRFTRRFGTGMVTAVSVLTTAAALWGFSVAKSFPALCLWAVPYGLGAGSVDASLNNYVALHYESRHMSWLHCMWGIGASAGPYIMGMALTGGYGWNMGYRAIALIQIVLTAILFFSLPLWKGKSGSGNVESGEREKPLSLKEIYEIPGAKEIITTFFCYQALEQTAGLWAASYLALHRGLSGETAAGFAALFYVGITIGRMGSGFLTMVMEDEAMIRLGQGVVLSGLLILWLPGTMTASAGLVLMGLGCAPIYPCIIHSTPVHFGADKSQAVIGVQMASAYVGGMLMPPAFGLLAGHISAALYPLFLFLILLGMIFMHEATIRRCRPSQISG